LRIIIFLCLLALIGCATVEETKYLLGSELKYSLDNKAWVKKYGEVPKPEKEYKEFPYGE